LGTNIYKQVHNYSIETGKIFTKQCKNKKSVKVMSTVNNKKGRRRKRKALTEIYRWEEYYSFITK